MSITPNVLSVHLGPRGLEYKTRDEAIVEMKRELQASIIDPIVVRDEQEMARRLEKQTEARRRFSEARFHQYRDASDRSADIANDPRRRTGRFSLTRDMIEGPSQMVNLYDLRGGRLNQRSIGDAGHDRKRFVVEANMLKMQGLVDDHKIEWDDDDSIFNFFCHVYDKALEEARNPKSRGHNRVIDNAPGIFVFTELLKRSEKLIEEDFTKLWARRIFPIMDLNTWLPQWMYERFDERAVFPSLVDIEYLPSNAPRGSENRAAVPRPLVFWHHAASWSNLELMRYAEAMANGAPNIQLDQRRINMAIKMMDWMEDIFAFFGEDDLDIQGLFSAEAKTGIQRVASGGQFGSGTTEQDRELLTREVKRILRETEQELVPDTILLSTETWLYVNDKRYGDVTADSNQTVLEAANATLSKFGIRDILWVPEVGYSSAQKTRLKQHGLPDAAAERFAGGIGGKQDMVVMKRDESVLEMVVAKNRVMYPARETVHDRVEARMLQGGGGMVFYRPKGIKIVTDVGPDPAP